MMGPGEVFLALIERIVTDGGVEAAAQIDALRPARLGQGDKAQ